MRRRRVLFTACLTAGTLAGAAAGVDAMASGLSSRIAELSAINFQDGLLIGAAGGQFISLLVAGILLAVADRRGSPFHAFAGAAWGAAAGAVGTWIPLWIVVAAAASC